MQPQNDVPTLFSLCGKSLEDFLVNLSQNFLINDHASLDVYSGQIESCKMQLCKIPSQLHNMLAGHCLKAADRIAKQYCLNAHKSFKSQVVVQHLVSIVIDLKLTEVYFRKWSKSVQASLLNFLWKMTHLEILNYNPSYGFPFSKESRRENLKKLQESLPFLTCLTKFLVDDCSDAVIATLCENCKFLEEIDVWCGEKITDKSIDSLVCCKNLRKVCLLSSKITAEGYMELFLNTHSENLVEVGSLANFSDLLHILETNMVPFRTFQTHQIDYTQKFDGRHLHLIGKYFPCITSLCFLLEIEELQFFSCLDSLKHTEEVVLSVPVRGAGHINQIYALTSQVLTSLLLNSGLKMSITRLISIGLQCPNLESLTFEDCSFIKDLDLSSALTFSSEKPFQKLKTFSFNTNSTSISGAESILILATNVEDIFIADDGSISDVFLTSILKFNALKELKRLSVYPANLSLNVIKSVVLSCEKMTFLGNLAPSDNAYYSGTLSKEDFASLQKFIAENNRNINLE